MTSNDSNERCVTRRKKVFGRSLDDDLFRTIYESDISRRRMFGWRCVTQRIAKEEKHKKCGCNPVMGPKTKRI